MESGIPILTQKGEQAVKNLASGITARCRNVLVQVDGKRSLDDIRSILRGLEGVEESISRLLNDGYVELSFDCKDIVRGLVSRLLGVKAPTLLKKIDDMHAKYGDGCWERLDELDKTARLLYGEIVAEQLKTEIAKVLQKTRK